MVVAAWWAVSIASAVSVAELPRPAGGAWVTDQAGVIDDADEAALNERIAALNRDRGAEIAVVTVSDVPGTPKQFATELFEAWGIGSAERDDGLLVLLVTGQRRLEMETGVGLEPVLTDGWLGSLQADVMVPRFKAGDYGGGLVDGIGVVDTKLRGGAIPSASPVVRRPTKTKSGLPMGLVAFGAIGGGFLVLFGAIVAIVRRGERSCPECEAPMRLLDEAADDAHLNPAQRKEEALGSVDYDVRMCDACGAIDIADREAWFTSYGRCPSCHTRAYRRHTKTLQQATHFSGGTVEVTERCEHCAHQRQHTYSTPPVPIVHTSTRSSRSSSFGGSSFGGSSRSSSSSSRSSSSSSRSSSSSSRSFGGGRSRGGGAGSSW